MIRISYILIGLALFSLSLFAQKSRPPRRTAEDIASKQTEMLVRELEINDNALRDTLFRMHLKYAELQLISNTRNEAIQRMVQMQAELKNILSPEQYEAFMNCQVDTTHTRLPHHPCNWIGSHPHGTPPPMHGEPNMPPPPPKHLPSDHQ